MFSEKLSYFIIAFSIYLLGKSILFFTITPPIYLMFDFAIAISLLCGNVPRVLPIPFRTLCYLHKIEYASLGVAIIALFMMFLQ